MGKKTEGESADSNYVDGKAKDEGQRRDFWLAARTGSEMAVMRRPFGRVIMTRFNFKVKGHFTPKLGGMCRHQILTLVKVECCEGEKVLFGPE